MRRVLLTNSDKMAIVSDEDYENVIQYRWFLKNNGKGTYYVARSVRRKSKVTTIHLHRFIMCPDDGYDVHHKNGNPLNCSRPNLECLEHKYHASAYYGRYVREWNEYVEQTYS